MLVTGDSSGRLVSQWLSPCLSLSVKGKRQINLKSILQPHLPQDWTLKGAFATMYGDIVCVIDSSHDDHLARVTTDGQVIWFITCERWAVAIRYVLSFSNLSHSF